MKLKIILPTIILGAVVFCFITTPMVIAQNQIKETPHLDIFEKAYETSLCNSSEQINVDLRNINIDSKLYVQPLTFGYKVAKVNQAVFGTNDILEMQDNFGAYIHNLTKIKLCRQTTSNQLERRESGASSGLTVNIDPYCGED